MFGRTNNPITAVLILTAFAGTAYAVPQNAAEATAAVEQAKSAVNSAERRLDAAKAKAQEAKDELLEEHTRLRDAVDAAYDNQATADEAVESATNDHQQIATLHADGTIQNATTVEVVARALNAARAAKVRADEAIKVTEAAFADFNKGFQARKDAIATSVAQAENNLKAARDAQVFAEQRSECYDQTTTVWLDEGPSQAAMASVFSCNGDLGPAAAVGICSGYAVDTADREDCKEFYTKIESLARRSRVVASP